MNRKHLPGVSFAVLLVFSLAVPSTASLPGGSLRWDNSTTVRDRELNKLLTVLGPYKAHIQQAIMADSDDTPLLTCSLCTGVMQIVRPIAIQLPDILAKWIAVQVCTILELAPRSDICQPIINNYADQILHLIRNKPDANDGTEICGMLIEDCTDGYPVIVDWNVDVPDNKPAAQNVTDPVPANKTEVVTFLQFTDIHMDLDYQVGSKAECGNIPICCRLGEGMAGDDERGAGEYGDMKCALPEKAYRTVLDHAKATFPEVKYVFLTGDYIHSGVWLYNKNENDRHIKHVIDMTVKTFGDVKVYPIVGNHEPHVVNMFPPPELWDQVTSFDLSWLYETVHDSAQPNFVLPPEQEDTFFTWGYYTVSPEPGLRFIFLNTNLCNGENYWLAWDGRDPGGQLLWLARVLQSAETAGESVYIIGHVEPGNCFSRWTKVFVKIVGRYEGIIKAGFYGHSHKPQYRTYFINGTDTPMSHIGIIAGSVLTDGMNPLYSAYHVDGHTNGNKTWNLLRHEQHILKVWESNEKNTPVFERSSDSWEDFQMDNFTGEAVLDLGKRIICKQELMDSYLRFHHKGNDSWSLKPCPITSKQCLVEVLGDFVSPNKGNFQALEYFQNFVTYTACSQSKAGGRLALTGGGMIFAFLVFFVRQFV